MKKLKKLFLSGVLPLLAVTGISAGIVFADNPHKTVGPAGYNTNDTLVIAGTSPTPSVGPGDHVVICHALGNVNGSYQQLAPSAGDVFGHAGQSHQSGMDIIPPFNYVDNQDHTNSSLASGQNWNTAGIAIYDNGCVAPTPPEVTDLCVNIDGVQTEVPAGMTRDDQGNCTTPSGGQGGGQVLGQTTTATVSVTPTGGVNAGAGGGSALSVTAL